MGAHPGAMRAGVGVEMKAASRVLAVRIYIYIDREANRAERHIGPHHPTRREGGANWEAHLIEYMIYGSSPSRRVGN